ncbi:MAG: hypothetical protein WCP55_13165, partial [Lentisphaerota bacterium]
LGVFTLYASDGIKISCCLMDGRWTYYSTPFISAVECADIQVRNCVVTTGMANMHANRCPRLTLEHNVFVRPMIFQGAISGGPTYVSHNIFTDNIPNKEVVPLFELTSTSSIAFNNNCFYLRAPDTKRKEKMFRFLNDEEFGDTPLTRLATMAQYEAKAGDSHTLFTDPKFAGARKIGKPGTNGQELSYTVDAFIKSAHLLVGPADELEFSDFFATDKETVERGIGLQPEAFKDFNSEKAENNHKLDK